jgi:hypothetical protein
MRWMRAIESSPGACAPATVGDPRTSALTSR